MVLLQTLKLPRLIRIFGLFEHVVSLNVCASFMKWHQQTILQDKAERLNERLYYRQACEQRLY